MKSTVETLGPTRVRLAIEVPFAELEPSLRKAYREIAQQVTVPGFRKGKVPATVIDQRVGRGTVLNEAVQDAIPEHLVAAVKEHDVKTLGRPEVDITEFADGQPLRFTAEVDVRPEIDFPDLTDVAVVVDEVAVTDEELDEQVNTLRDRFATLKTVERATQTGDYVQIDLAATVDGQDVPGGTASNISHEVGSNALLPGLDEALVGLSAGESTTFTSQLAGGDYAGQDATVSVTVRTVKEKELPALDDEFAGLASEFDTLDELRGDLRERMAQGKGNQQLFSARDKVLEKLIELSGVPAPEGVVREEVEHRKQALTDELQRIGASLPEYLSAEGRSEEDLDAELLEAANEGVKVQLLLDALADRENVQVSDSDYTHEIVHRAQQVGMEPTKYHDLLMRSGSAVSVYGDIRRNKALNVIMRQVKISDTAGKPVDLSALTAEHNHDHEGHDHEGHQH